MRKREFVSQKEIDQNANNLFLKKKRNKFIYILCTLLMLLLLIAFLILYGPFTFFRDCWITTAMTTKNHQYLAKMFYSEKTIYEVMDQNIIVEIEEVSDESLIDFNYNYSNIFENKYEREILENVKEDEKYRLIPIQGDTYRGYLVAIYDPSKVELATSKYLGSSGQFITDVSKETNAFVAMNASGYYDPQWKSDGELPHGIVIKNGKIVSEYDKADVGGGFIGFTEDHKLILGKMEKEEALAIQYRDAIEFGPFLIVNGKKAIINGNGGWGVSPRSAIGQRKDGIVLFLVIDGRLTTSIGADMNDIADIFFKYGAVNAANLDGGSSSELLIKNKIVNRPVGNGKNGLRKMPTFWIVK